MARTANRKAGTPAADPAWEAIRRERRELYRWNRSRLAPFAIVDEVPTREGYTVGYHTAMMDAVMEAGENLAHVPMPDPWAHPSDPAALASLFPLLPAPQVYLQNYWRDWFFAEQRLSGPNPMVVEAVRGRSGLAALRERIPIQDAHLRRAVVATGGVGARGSLEAAAEDGHLLVADYRLLDGLPQGHWRGGRKHLAAPIAVFAWRSTGHGDRGELVPIAIQLGQLPSGNVPVITPAEDEEWRLAKLFVQVADANHHEMVSHLAETHLAVEPFVVATARNLPDHHPVARLLRPHSRFTLARNREAQLRLIQPDGPVDELLASSLSGSLEMARRSRAGHEGIPGWNLERAAFDRRLAERGLSDPSGLPHFPYRDDGLLLWAAILAMVEEYVALFYPGPAEVSRDPDLAAWCRDLASPEGGAVPGMPGRIETPAELVRILATVIFLAGPQHAATNFPQYDAMGFAGNMPLAAYQPPPDRLGSGRYDAAYLSRTLPPYAMAAKQLLVIYTLSAVRTDRLGDYRGCDFAPEAEPVLAAFRRELVEIEARMEERDAERRLGYGYLRPSRVPNSISV